MSHVTDPSPDVLERLFRLRAHGSTPAREMLAGLTTFATMAFILVVNPVIMSGAGMDRIDLTIATALAAMIGSALIGLMSNQPLAAAPAMGSNVVFASVLVGQMGIPWQAGLAMVLATGVIFLGLSVSRLRERVVAGVPQTLRAGIQAAIGLLIMFVALRGAGIVVASPGTLLRLGPIGQPAVLLPLLGLLLTPLLVLRRVPGALLLSIATIAAIGLVVPDTHGRMLTRLPAHLVAWPHWPSKTALKPDFGYVASHLLLCAPLMVYFFCSEFFSTLGTLISVTGSTGMRDSDGRIEGATRVFTADALASIAGPLLGTAVVTAFVESVAGVQAGGRTGLTALTAAALFGLGLFFWPLLIAIPSQATAPAIFFVGIMMIQGLAGLDLSRLDEIVPVVTTMVGAVLTGNLVNGMALGTFSFVLVELTQGRGRRIGPVIWCTAAIFLCFYGTTLRFH